MQNLVTERIITLSIIMVLIILLTGCIKEKPAKPDNISIFTDVYTDKSRYAPGETVSVYVDLYNNTDQIQTGNVNIRLKYLGYTIYLSDNQEVSLDGKKKTQMTFTFVAPNPDFTGYVLEASFLKGETIVDKHTSAVDVSSDWSKFPRYGYLVSYGLKPLTMIESTLDDLNKYHINGLQFYDWQWKHHMPLPIQDGKPLEKWQELSNRDVYLSTIQGYIDEAHKRNMMAMNYNLLFGTYDHPEADGVRLEWGLFVDAEGRNIDYHGLPTNWQTSRLLIMNPANKDWQNYIFTQEAQAINTLNFDGWHVDQLGYRGPRYDKYGNIVDMEAGYVDLLINAKDTINTRLVFNAVDGFGQSRLAKEVPVDFLYQEVWTPKRYYELKQIIDKGFVDTNYQKSTVLAAYMNYGKRDKPGLFNKHAVLLTNATIFASGGAHLELGDTGMLSSEYFPSNNLKMSLELKTSLRSYYDFLVAYQNFLRDNVRPSNTRLEINGVKTSVLGLKDTVWYFAKTKDNYQIIHLINILDNEDDWRDDEADKKAPPILEHVEVKLYLQDEVKKLYLASPDNDTITPIELTFTRKADYISFTLPRLEYWSMLVVEK
ncbi:MAG: dextranase [Bacilli bacterium]|nr:dextranase [Bacilli bacterium]